MKCNVKISLEIHEKKLTKACNECFRKEEGLISQ